MPKNRHMSYGDMQAQRAREKKLTPVVPKPVEQPVDPAPTAEATPKKKAAKKQSSKKS